MFVCLFVVFVLLLIFFGLVLCLFLVWRILIYDWHVASIRKVHDGFVLFSSPEFYCCLTSMREHLIHALVDFVGKGGHR